MDTVKRITKNTAYVLGGNLLAALMSFLLNIYIARYLGTEVFGRYSFVFAYLSFFMVVSIFGIDSILVRELSRAPEKKDKLMNTSIALKLLTSLGATIVSIILILILPYESSIRLGVIFASLGLVLYSLAQTITAFFQSRLEMIYSSIATVLSKLVFVGLTLWVIFTNGGFVKMIIAQVGAFLMLLAILWFFARGKFHLAPKLIKGYTPAMIRESWPLALMNMFITIYYRIDVVMLSLLKGTEQVGFYSVGYTIIEAPALISVAFMTSMFPLMSLHYKSSNTQFKEIYVKSFKYMAMLALPVVFGGFLLKEELIPFIYGPSYLPSVPAFGILIFGSAFIMLNVVGANVITAINKQKANMTILAIATVLNVGMNLVLIPSLGLIGAAIVTVITELFIFLAFIWFIYRHTNILPMEGLFKILLACIAMAAFIIFTNIPLIPTFVVASVIYCLSVYLFRVLDGRDLELLKRMISKKN